MHFKNSSMRCRCLRWLSLLLIAVALALTLLYLRSGDKSLRFENAQLEHFKQNFDIDAHGLDQFMLNGILIVPSLHPQTDTVDHSISIFSSDEPEPPSIAQARFPTTDIHLDVYSKEPNQTLRLVLFTHTAPYVSYSYQQDLTLSTAEQPEPNALYKGSAVLQTDLSTSTLLYGAKMNNGYLRLTLAFEQEPDSTETIKRYYLFKTHLPKR